MAKEFNIPKQGESAKLRDLGIPSPVIPSKEKAFNIGKAVGISRGKEALIKSKIKPYEVDRIIATSKLGTPVYSRVVLKQNLNTVVGNAQTGDGYVKLDTCLVKVSQSKNIIKTAIQGRDGAVKEYIAAGDYQISIEGQLLSNSPYKLPVEELANLIALLTEPNEIVIDSDFVQMFGVTYVVVESFNHDQIEGSRGRLNFSISLLSDYPAEFELGISDA